MTAFLEDLHAAADDAAIVEAFLPTACAQNHAANLTLLPNGELLCVWFGGTQEGLPDISIYLSRLSPGAHRWSDPVKLSNDAARSEQNPVLFQAPDGKLWLLYTSQSFGNQETAVVRYRISQDAGQTWGDIGTLIDDPGTFIRQPIVVRDDGAWLLPIFRCRVLQGEKWDGSHDSSAVLISRDEGRSWRERVVPASTGCVHMNIVRGREGFLALYRSRWADRIYRSHSADGAIWSAPEPTELPNNNSSIQATRLFSGALAVVFNESSAAQATERRVSLYDEIDDGSAKREAPPTDTSARRAFWGAPRAPMTIALSDDDGQTWPWRRSFAFGDGYCLTNNSEDKRNRELSYPSIVQSRDGIIHVAFTHFRQRIRYVRLTEAWVRSGVRHGDAVIAASDSGKWSVSDGC